VIIRLLHDREDSAAVAFEQPVPAIPRAIAFGVAIEEFFGAAKCAEGDEVFLGLLLERCGFDGAVGEGEAEELDGFAEGGFIAECGARGERAIEGGEEDGVGVPFDLSVGTGKEGEGGREFGEVVLEGREKDVLRIGEIGVGEEKMDGACDGGEGE